MRSDIGVLPRDVDTAVRALCADYSRRSEVIKDRSASYRVIMEYRYLNYRIYTAACEAVGEDDALGFIEVLCLATDLLVVKQSKNRYRFALISQKKCLER